MTLREFKAKFGERIKDMELFDECGNRLTENPLLLEAVVATYLIDSEFCSVTLNIEGINIKDQF